jgi:glycosyltransferase involved in cell wall biosynthesis
VPVILNPLVSLADTLVDDRARFGEGSLAARALLAVDRRAFGRADVVVADTEAHAELFSSLGARRVEVVPVGADERIFHPPWRPTEGARVLFVGKLIPLHGVGTITDAARLLSDVRFRIVGEGQLAEQLRERTPNVEWVRWLEYERLGDEYRRASCALGIFGTTAKAGRVIPNKAYHAIACGTPLVTADTRAARELLVDEASALLVPPGDPRALAGAIERLLADNSLQARLSKEGAAAYERHAADRVLADRWREIVEHVTG